MLHGWASRRSGQWEQSVNSMEQALRLDPRAVFNWVEFSQTLNYLHRFEASRQALLEANRLDPTNFYVKLQASDLAINAEGDIDTALRVTTGVQHTGEPISIPVYVEIRQLARQFEEALVAAQAMPEAVEVQRAKILVREELLAMTHFLAGEREAAKEAADAAWFRLQNMRQTLGDDYRILHAEVTVAALRGDPPESLKERIERAIDARPSDAVEEMIQDWEISRALGLAGMAEEVTSWLSTRLEAPSFYTARRVTLDPAFDTVREDLAFATMLERQLRGDSG